MIDVKTNFKSKYVDDMTCRLCGLEEETFDHLFRCNKYQSKVKETLDNRFNPKWIQAYGNNIEQMKLVALTVEKILKIREETIKKKHKHNNKIYTSHFKWHLQHLKVCLL